MSKQKPVFNGLSIAQKYRQELEGRLKQPTSIQTVNNIKSVINDINDKSNQVSDNKMTPEQFVAWADTRNKEIDKLRQSIGTEYEQQINLEGAGSIVRGEFPLAGSVSGGLFKVINAISDDKLSTGRKIVDVGLGVAQTGINLIPQMAAYNMAAPLGRPLAMSLSNRITGNPEIGAQIYDYGSMLPFGAKVFLASLGSKGISYGVEKVLNNPESFSGILDEKSIETLKGLPDEDKNRIIEGSHHAGFLATMWGVGKVTKGLELNKEFRQVREQINLSKVDEQVRNSMNPKNQGEKQIDIRNDKLTQETVKETKVENVKQKSNVGDVAEVQKPTEKIERRTDKSGKEYYYNTETKKRTTQEEYLKENKNATPIRSNERPIQETGDVRQTSESKSSENLQQQTPEKPSNTQEQVKSIVESQDARYEGTDKKGNVSFTNKKTGSTFQLDKKDVTPETVKRILENDKGKPIDELPVRGTKEEIRNVFDPKPIDKQIVENPRSNLPKLLDDKMYESAGNMKAQVEGASVLKQSPTFRRENVGSGWEVTKSTKGFTVSDFPQWFRDLGKSRKEIINGLDKILQDKGRDKGKLVEELKSIIFDHWKNGQEDYIYENTGGKSKKVLRGEIPADADVADFLNRFTKDEVSLKDLHDAYKQYEAETSFPFGANEKSAGEFQGEGFNKPSFKKSEDYLRPKGKGEETTPLFNQKQEVKGQENLFDKDLNKPTGNSTLDRLRQEALNEFKNNQTANIGLNPLAYKNQIKYGASLIKEGAVKFADWSQRMIKDLGEKIKPHLLSIWSEVKKLGEDLGKIALEKISDFVESKYNPARPLKVMEGDLISGDSPLARQLNKPKEGKIEVSKAEETTRQLRTANYYQDLIGRKLVDKERSEQKEILKEAVQTETQPIKYNIFTPSNLGKEKNPLIQGTYQLLFDKREQFKKDFEGFIQDTNKLIRKSRQSRKTFELIREDKEVIDYLEGKKKFEDLTPQEKQLATYTKQWLDQAKDTMTNKNARENYVTHIKRGFPEIWKQEGFWEAAKSLFKEKDANWERQVIADIDLMMAKEKFNPFAITRKTNMPYTRDLGKIMETYGKIFFLKKHFDSVRPQINILNNLLGKEGRLKEKNFLKRYVKKMTGENIDNLTPEMLKKVSSNLMRFTGLRFLAWNLPAGIVNTAAGIVDNFINIPMGSLARGNIRFETKQGQRIIKNNNVVDVENLDAAIGLRQQLGKAIDIALFLPMRGGWRLPWGEHYIQGSAYLGMLNEKEFKTGQVSLERHRQILEKIGNIHGAYRDNLAPDAKQTLGTREALQFKLWMFAKVRNRWERYGTGLIKPLLTGKAGDIKPENLRSIAKELGLVATAIVVANDDDSPLKQPIQDILSDLYGVFNPRGMAGSVRRGIPAVGTLLDLYDLVDSFFSQDRYKTSNKKYGINKGDLKATKKLERLIPLYRQYQKHKGGTSSGGSGIPELQLPEIKLPEIQ